MDLLEPSGDLPYAVIGIKAGFLQVCPADSYQVFYKPLCLPMKSFQEAPQDASNRPVTRKHTRSFFKLKGANEWASSVLAFISTSFKVITVSQGLMSFSLLLGSLLVEATSIAKDGPIPFH
jgi:hypothetical protein